MAKQKITEEGEVITLATPFQSIQAEAPFWKTPYNHDRDAESLSTALECKDESRTQQQHARDADINVILAKFLKTGELNQIGSPQYMDIAELSDLQDVIVTRAQVDEAWNALPKAVQNMLRDPGTFVAYVDHCLATGDIEPLRELGLAKTKEPPPEPAPAPAAAAKAGPGTEGGTPAPAAPQEAPKAS